MKRYVVGLLLTFLVISGCLSGIATKVVTSAVKPKSGIDASVNGEAKNQLVGQKTEETTEIKAGDNSVITENKSETTNKTTNVPSWLIWVACLAVPGPYELSKGFIKIVKLFKKEL